MERADRRVSITAGIGPATAGALHAAGMCLVLTGRRQGRSDELA